LKKRKKLTWLGKIDYFESCDFLQNSLLLLKIDKLTHPLNTMLELIFTTFEQLVFLKQQGQCEKIESSLKPNHHNQVKLLQTPDKFSP